MYGVALGRFHPESQDGHLSFEVTRREHEQWDKRSQLKGGIKGDKSRVVRLSKFTTSQNKRMMSSYDKRFRGLKPMK